MERINYGLREEIAVLKEDVKGLNTIKRALGREAFEELLNTAKSLIRKKEWER